MQQHQSQTRLTILRRPAVEAQTGESRSTLYLRMSQGLFPRPVRLGGKRAVGWPAHEVSAINQARIAGHSEREIRALVEQIYASRAVAQ